MDQKQNDWDQHLALVEFAYNNSKQASTGFSPFYLNYGQHPFLPSSLLIPTSSNSNAAAEDLLEQLFNNLKIAESNVVKAQEKQQQYVNQHRRAEEFEVGNKVLLSSEDLNLKMKITPKLTPRYIGPFTIKRKLSSLNYELELPPSLSIHPIFHITKLKSFTESPQFTAYRPPLPSRPPPEIVDGTNEWDAL